MNAILNNIKKVIIKFFQYLVNFGINNSTNQSEIKRIKLLNIFSWFWHLRTIGVFFKDQFNGETINEGIIDVFYLSLNVVIIQTLQYHKKYRAARLLFIFSIMFFSFIYGVYLGPNQSSELNLILVPGLIVVLLNNQKLIYFLSTLSIITLYITIYVIDLYHGIKYNYFGTSIILISVFIMIDHLKKLNLKNEAFLKEKTIELEELGKFKSHFFTNISHEIRTPLTIIKGEIDYLTDDDLSKEKIELIHKKTNNQINNITSIVNTVMNLGKMKSSNFNLNKTQVDVIPLIKKIHTNFESIFNQNNITFSLETLNESSWVTIDSIFIERALNNILNNAYKYTEEGSVTIKAYEEEQFLYIEISDTGIGISSKNQDNIFRSFYQVNNDINQSGGSGVGLSFSKEIINLHNGEITVKSKHNEGSCFTISLPLDEKNSDLIPKNKVLKNQDSFLIEKNNSLTTFLIVDDNEDMRNYLKNILKNHNCILATNGKQALEILKINTIDFIITDYMMPKMNGLVFSKKLNQLKIDIPVIMITAKTAVETKLEVLSLGVKDYITKPFDKNELLVRINNLLKKQTTKIEYKKNLNIKPEDNYSEFISKLEIFINNNSNNNKELTQEFLSVKFNISKSSLYRQIKSETGLSPKEYITEIRLQKARRILENNPNILLKQVTLEVGFQHSSYFSKLFTERFGYRPK